VYATNVERGGMVKEPIYRSFSEADAPGVHDVALESWRHTYRTIFDSAFIENFVHNNYAPERLINLVTRIQNGEMFFDVALVDSQIVGFCHIGIIPDQRAQLFRIYLSPSYIGQGIGRKLLQLGEPFIIAKGLNSYFCFVHKENELGKAFYLRNGFQHVPEKDNDDEWYIEKSLT
jgi:ribosomal protein S18 acetylase RimI-like enzyme